MIDRFSILPIRSLGQDVRWTSDASPSTVQDRRVDHRSGNVLLPRTLDLAALLRHMPRAPREPRPVDVLLMLNSTRDRKLTETQSHSHHQERTDTLNELNGIPVESFPTLDAAVERLRELLQAGKNPVFLLEGDAIPGPNRSPTT